VRLYVIHVGLKQGNRFISPPSGRPRGEEQRPLMRALKVGERQALHPPKAAWSPNRSHIIITALAFPLRNTCKHTHTHTHTHTHMQTHTHRLSFSDSLLSVPALCSV